METKINLYLDRAENELVAGEILFKISFTKKIQT